MATPREAPDLLFYDGGCGLCHGLVRFLARRSGTCRFAPLGGATFRERFPEADPPASVVVVHGDRVLLRSEAVLHLLLGLGGGWTLLARLGGRVPRGLRDGAYDVVARARNRLFSRPESACPRVPPSIQARFLP
ncbi:thiol-disulfide oxidoreductase DCC family protein [Geothrix sp. 21YS21S-2]|uniref:thiol-disulfide oxidoreductase DCC family protein n=1 Tax=Geothrix sp. 21YS21S-2 TaxID=3068893 RepID=UPI0027BA2456|nr:DCC1-like thiol-disulfide oxidoreductase family protein [Geothrix sp. 21YS21S-2]